MGVQMKDELAPYLSAARRLVLPLTLIGSACASASVRGMPIDTSRPPQEIYQCIIVELRRAGYVIVENVPALGRIKPTWIVKARDEGSGGEISIVVISLARPAGPDARPVEVLGSRLSLHANSGAAEAAENLGTICAGR